MIQETQQRKCANIVIIMLLSYSPPKKGFTLGLALVGHLCSGETRMVYLVHPIPPPSPPQVGGGGGGWVLAGMWVLYMYHLRNQHIIFKSDRQGLSFLLLSLLWLLSKD